MVQYKNMIEAARAVRQHGLKISLLTNNFWFDKDHKISLLGLDTDMFDVVSK